MNYRHLIESEQYQINAFLWIIFSKLAIATRLNRSQSTLLRKSPNARWEWLQAKVNSRVVMRVSLLYFIRVILALDSESNLTLHRLVFILNLLRHLSADFYCCQLLLGDKARAVAFKSITAQGFRPESSLRAKRGACPWGANQLRGNNFGNYLKHLLT